MYTPEIIEAAPDLTPSTLHAIRPATVMVVQSQLEQGNDSLYDHFMYDHVGDPFDSSRQPIKIKSKPDGTFGEYDKRFFAGFSDRGSLVLIKKESIAAQSPQYLGDRIIDDPSRYYFVKADLTDKYWQYQGAWEGYQPVIRAEHVNPSYIGRQIFRTELYLGDHDTELVTAAEICPSSDTLTSKLSQTLLNGVIEDFWASRTRIIFDGDQIALNVPGRAPERLTSIEQLAAQLRDYGPSIAKCLIREQIEVTLLQVPAVQHDFAASPEAA